MSFDHLAPHYRWMEAIIAGPWLQRARRAHLPSLDQATHVLLVGEGPGRFLAALRARRPGVQVTVLDVSAQMLHAARQVGRGADVTFVQGDVRTWSAPPGSFDAIVTCCVLDCFRPSTVGTVVERLAAMAGPVADWLHVDFSIPSDGWRRQRAQLIHRLMYLAFRAATAIEAREVTAPDAWLRATGFTRRSATALCGGLLRSEHWRREPRSSCAASAHSAGTRADSSAAGGALPKPCVEPRLVASVRHEGGGT